MNFDGGSTSRRATCIIQTMDSEAIIAFDVRYLVLTHYCCYLWWTIFFMTSAVWRTSLSKAIDHVDVLTSIPSNWLLTKLICWPLDGVLLRLLFFAFLIIAQLYVVACCVVSSITTVICKICIRIQHCEPFSATLLAVPSLISATSDQVLEILFLSSHKVNHAFTTNLVLSRNNLGSDSNISWDSDSTTVVVDNAANTHIWNTLDDFVQGSIHYFDANDDVGVLTIDKDSSRPIGIGTVIIGITTSSGKVVEIELKNCLLSLLHLLRLSALLHWLISTMTKMEHGLKPAGTIRSLLGIMHNIQLNSFTLPVNYQCYK